jgi:hypothetical protein
MAKTLFGRRILALAAAGLLSLGIVGSASAELIRGVENGGCLSGIQVGTMQVGGKTYAICQTF